MAPTMQPTSQAIKMSQLPSTNSRQSGTDHRPGTASGSFVYSNGKNVSIFSVDNPIRHFSSHDIVVPPTTTTTIALRSYLPTSYQTWKNATGDTNLDKFNLQDVGNTGASLKTT